MKENISFNCRLKRTKHVIASTVAWLPAQQWLGQANSILARLQAGIKFSLIQHELISSSNSPRKKLCLDRGPCTAVEVQVG
jgi:hypothetical protein